MKCIYEYEQNGIAFRTEAVFEKGHSPAQSPIPVAVRFPQGTTQREVEKHFRRFIRIVFKDLTDRGARVRQ